MRPVSVGRLNVALALALALQALVGVLGVSVDRSAVARGGEPVICTVHSGQPQSPFSSAGHASKTVSVPVTSMPTLLGLPAYEIDAGVVNLDPL